MKKLQIKADASGTLEDVQVASAEQATQDDAGNVISTYYAARTNGYGGFVAGGNASAGAYGGAAIGAAAQSSFGGGAVGQAAQAVQGGGAIGSGASAQNGFAGGNNAKATVSGAVQLGTGTNSTSNTLQFRGYQVVDADGKIPDDRISDTFVKGSDLFSSSGEIILAEKLPSTVWGIPQTRLYTNYTFPSSGSSITPSRDGYFLISKRSGAAGQWLSVNQGYMTQVVAGSSDGSECSIVLPVVKSVPINISYTLTGESIRCMLVWTVSFG